MQTTLITIFFDPLDVKNESGKINGQKEVIFFPRPGEFASVLLVQMCPYRELRSL
jgi:hypothetical protein